MLIDCKIEISEELAAKILTGQDRIPTEAVVRGQTGKYDQFVPLNIISKGAEENTAVAANTSSNSLSIQNKALIDRRYWDRHLLQVSFLPYCHAPFMSAILP